MKILWLNAGLLLPLDKGGKLRTWHLMRHLRRATTSPISRSPIRSQPRTTAPACARSAAALRDDSRARDPRQGHARASTPTRRATSSIRCRTPSPSTARRPIARAAASSCSRTEALRRRRLRLPAAGRQPAGAAALPGDPLHAQRRGGDLAAARRERHQSRVAVPAYGSSGGGCCASSATALARFDLVLAVSDADGETFAAALSRTRLRRRCTSCRPGSTPHTSRRSPSAPARRAHIVFTGSMDWLPNEDGDDATSAATSCR